MSAPHDPLVLGRSVNEETAHTETPNSDAVKPTMYGSEVNNGPQTNKPDLPAILGDRPSPPKLLHTRTAPTTVPANPVAFAPGTEHLGSVPESSDSTNKSDDEGSSAATLGDEHGVPLVVGGLHGRPFPGSRMERRVNGEPGALDLEKDHQAAHAGAPGGQAVAQRAKADLGLIDEKASTVDTLPPSPTRKIERTASGTHVYRRAVDHKGQATVRAYGMVPIARQISQPPVVGLFGGVAPSGEDAEMGLVAVRSREEEDERQAEMKRKGPDPFAVRFEPGDPTNPKVSDFPEQMSLV